MKIQMKKRASVLAATALAATAVFGGVAVAAWLADGTGTGSAKAVTAIALTTSNSSSVASAQLFPGGSGSLMLTLNNPNPYPVTITDIVQDGTVTATGGTGTCTTTGVSMADISGVSHSIAANGSLALTLAGAVSMDNTSDNGCQGATFTVPVAVTGASGS